MAQNGNGEKEVVALTPKALGGVVAAVLVALGVGGVGYAARGSEAQAASGPCPSTSELGQVRERLVAVEVTVVEMNKKLDSLVAVKERQR